MLTITAIVVTAVISWATVDFALNLTRQSAVLSLIVWGLAITSGAVIGWAIVDGIAFMIRGDVAVEA